jgi:Tfp pilus assembly protein PilO
MERPDRNEKDDAQKAKLIFFSLAALVTILLIWSFYTANNARQQRDTARQETEQLRQDNAKLEQMLNDQNQINDDLKKKLEVCESKPVLKPKPAAKKPASKKSKKRAAKKSSRSKRTR